MTDINNFDVLKRMSIDNRDIRLGVDLVRAKKVVAGTEVTIGIGCDMVGSIVNGDLSVCLLAFDKKQFDEVKSAMEQEATR